MGERAMVAGTYAPLWNVPYQRNRFFTGRERELGALYHALQAESAVALCHPLGISGLGGIGKTQTALEYAYRYAGEYKAVLWVRADSLPALTSSFVELARVLELPERYEQDQRIIVEAALRWLRQNSQWLLIFDNMDDPSIAEPFLPKAGPGHILFTTRAHAFGELAQRLEVQQMEPETGALLLLRRASILHLRALLEAATRIERDMACAISQELDGLPLALDQAGAYIKETPYPLSDYLSLYQQRRSDLLQTRGELNKDYPASVAATWSLSFEKMTRANAASAELLHLCAFLAPDAIPEEIFTTGALYLGKILAPVAADPLQLDRACQDALRFSLIAREPDTQTLSIHRLVQAVLQDTLPPKTCAIWKRSAISAVKATFPNPQFENWTFCERLSPHALICANWIEKEHITSSEATELLSGTAGYLNHRARYGEAERLYRYALSIREKQLGARHPETAQLLNDLAGLCRHQGNYAEAESLLKRAISIFERQFGPNRPIIAVSLSGLGNLYMDQGRYAEAGVVYVRALAITEQHKGADHPETATRLNNLANLYEVRGRYAEAEALYMRVLSITEQHLGAGHPETATRLNNLAILYEVWGRAASAEELYLRALKIDEGAYGPDHPNVAIDLNNLAQLYSTQRKYEQAEPLFRRALSINERKLGTIHPEIAKNLHNLGDLYRRQGHYTEAEVAYKRALSIKTQQLGGTHSSIANSLNGLALLNMEQRKYAEAEPLYKQALAICEEQLGANHPKTAIALNNLAGLYDEQGMYAVAAPLYQRALSIAEEQLGTTHAHTQAIQASYTLLLQKSASVSDSTSFGPIKSMAPDLATTYNELLELISRLKSTLQVARSTQKNTDRFSEFTDTARNVLIFAQEEAQGFQHNYIGTEHLLLGLVRESEGVAAKALRSLGIELPKVRNTVESVIGRGDRIVPGEIGLTFRVKKVLELSVDEARLLHHHSINTEHLLLGLIREGEGVGANVLEVLRVSLERVRIQILHILNQPDQSVPRLLEEAHDLLEQILSKKEQVILEQKYELAAELHDQEAKLRDCIYRLEAGWFREQEQ
jgi:tetratricopeptide (TPR) repeat protein